MVDVEEAHERHAVVATVTWNRYSEATVVQARWPVAVGERTGVALLANRPRWPIA